MNKSRLAIASFTIAVCSFIHLFGIEKAVIAIVFGALALKEIEERQTGGRNFAYAAIALGTLYILVLAVVAVMKGPQLISLMGSMK